MWLLVIFTLTMAGEPGIEVLPMQTDKHCAEMQRHASIMLARPGSNIAKYYLECKPFRVS